MRAVLMAQVVRERGAARRGRRLWWRLHQWAGLQASLYLSFVCLTGTLAVLAYEIDWMVRPVMWTAPTPASERVSWGTVAAAVMDHAPGAEVLMLSAPLHAASTFDAVVVRDGVRRHVYVHPRTGAVTGEGAWLGVQRFLRDAHRRFMLPHTIGGVRVGIVLVCLSAVLLLFTLVSSFWVYKRWWRGFLRWPKGRDARSLIGDTHRFMGLWSLWFVLVMAWTGLLYLVEEFGARPPAPAQPGFAASLPAQDTTLARALDRGIAELQRARPNYEVRQVLWPSGESPAFAVRGRDDRAALVEDGANSVWIAADDGSLLGALDAGALTLHQRISVANNPLHFGTFAGYASKTVYFVFGLLLCALSVTGVAIYALRLLKAERRYSWRRGLLHAWRRMGWARWPSVVLCGLPFVLVFFV